MEILFSSIIGVIIGSFLSVCIFRIPHGRGKGISSKGIGYTEEDESQDSDISVEEQVTDDEVLTISKPARSLCPSCRAQLKWWHNIPVLSWMLLGGKCAFCKTPISVRYPAVELLSAVFCIFSFQLFDFPTALVVYVFCATLIVLSFIDIDYYILPNVITYPGVLIGVALAAVNHFTGIFAWPIVPDLLDSFLGFLAGAGFLWIISAGYELLRGRVGLGMGDVKLLAMVGVLFGPEAALTTIFLGSFLGAILGVSLILLFRQSMSKPLPFGPYLALGTVLHLFLGPEFPQDLVARYLYGIT